MTGFHCWRTRNEQMKRFTKAVFFFNLLQTEMLQANTFVLYNDDQCM